MPSWKLTIEKLVTQNCLLVGNHSKSTSKKVAKYLLGTRDTLEVFKLYELRYLLLKIYPLIHNLFHNPRVNPKLKFQDIWNLDPQPVIPVMESSKESVSLVKHQTSPAKFTWPFKRRFSFVVKRKNIPPQVLFTSITPRFSDIIYNAAQICNMPWHKNRWLSGSITAAISYPSDKLVWQYLQDKTQKKIFQAAFKQWGSNKENKEKIKEKIKHYSRSRWPSLLVIPDVSNNVMILKEARKVGLPVIGLVNSNCHLEIDYPVFAQDQTLESVHFFCHFLAVLIAKETVFLQHKRYTLQKILHKSSIIKESVETSLNAKFTLDNGVELQKRKEVWKKPFFFKIVRPWQKRFSKRYFLASTWPTYHPLNAEEWRYRTKKYKKKLPYKTVTTLVKQVRRVKIIRFPKKFSHVFIRSPLKNNDRSWSLKKKFFHFVDQKLFQNENEKKYFQKNRHTYREKKQIQQKLQNFLWFSSIMKLLIIQRRSFPRTVRFPTTPPYFRRSLEQWSHTFKWRNHRALIKKLLRLKLREKEDWNYKPFLFRKKSTPRRNKKNTLNAWEIWITQNIPKKA